MTNPYFPSTNIQQLQAAVAQLQLETPVVCYPTDNLPNKIASYPAGTSFLLTSGTYRLVAPIIPSEDQIFIGENNTILNGAIIVPTSAFTNAAGVYHASVNVQYAQDTGNGITCRVGQRCSYGNDVYIDNVLYLNVTSQAAVTAGSTNFYIDYTQPIPVLYIGTNPSGHVVEVCNTSYAFSNQNTVSGVQIKFLTIEKFANPAQQGAIGTSGNNWTIDRCEVRYNHAAGISMGPYWKLTQCYIHNNGQEGVSGFQSHHSLIENCEISFNNTCGFDPNWEGGFGKISSSTNVRVSNNYVHDNLGYGIWYDTDNIYSMIDGNLVENNLQVGIQYEISYEGTITNNVVRGNYLASPGFPPGQIQISTSQNVEVARNTVLGSYKGGFGIVLLQDNRGTGAFGTYQTSNVNVHDNDITIQGAQLRTIQFSPTFNASVALGLQSGNVFNNNHYHVPTGSLYDAFNTNGFSNFTFSGWQGRGYDLSSTIDVSLNPGLNLLLAPYDFTNTNWWGYGGGCVVTGNAGADPLGVVDASQIALTAGSTGTGFITQEFGARPGSVSGGLWVKGTVSQQVYLYLLDQAFSVWNHTLITFTGAWQQVSLLNVTIAGAAGDGSSIWRLDTAGNHFGGTQLPAVTFLAWGAQANEGATLNVTF